MLNDFKTFVLRGNVVDLAIGVAIGAAFADVVTSFTENLLTPLLAIPGDAASFSDQEFEVAGAVFRYGAVIDALIAFLIIAAVLFFVVVRPVNAMVARRVREPDADPALDQCPECLSAVPAGARRCAHCAQPIDH